MNFGTHRETGAPGGAPEIRDFGGTANAVERVTMVGRKRDRMKSIEQASARIGAAFVVSGAIVRQVRADNLKKWERAAREYGSLLTSLQACQSSVCSFR